MSIKQLGVSRRTFLKTMGSLAAYAPIANLMKLSMAQAQSAFPMRLVVMGARHGSSYTNWNPKPPTAFASGDSASNFTLTASSLNYTNSILSPLASLAPYVTVVGGLDFRVLYELDNADTGHYGGSVTQFTGTICNSNKPTGPSIDQYLASQFGSSTRFRSVNAGIRESFSYFEDGYSWTSGIGMVPDIYVPRTTNGATGLYETLFGTSTSTNTNTKKLAVLAQIESELGGLKGRLDTAGASKLDQHITALKNIEQTLNSTATCSAPVAPPVLSNSASNTDAIIDSELNILAQALKCDLTRFASFNFRDEPSGQSDFSWIPGAPSSFSSVHDNLAHMYDSSNPTGQVQLDLAQYQRYWVQKIANFATLLAGMPEGTGSVLDNTLIVFCASELGHPNFHTNRHVPYLMVGGAGGRFKVGRALNFDLTDAHQSAGQMIPHNQLLVSIAQAFGAQINTFGATNYSGPVSGLNNF